MNKGKFMKRILGVALAAVILAACDSNPNEFTVSGEMKNASGEKLYLVELQLNELKVKDSTIVKEDGQFSFTGETANPQFYVLRTEPRNFLTLIAAPKDDIVVHADIDNLNQTYSVTGSEDSRLIQEMQFQLNQTIEELDSLGRQLQSNMGEPDFAQLREQMGQKMQQVFENQRNFTLNYIEENKESLASMMALFQQVGPRNYVMDPNSDFEYFEMVDSALMANIPESETVKAFHSQVIEMRRQLGLDKEGTQRLSIGSVAPDIALPSPEGDTIKLSSLRGNYVLLDFWASWCRPCRVENPNLVKNYKEFNDKGFEIYQVSLDKTRSAWVNGIEKDNLDWYHVSDLQFWNSSAARKYNVQGIPASFLLDKEGRIIAKNLRGDALEAKLSEIFD